MITIRLFARLREQLGTAELQWPTVATVTELIAALASEHGSVWAQALNEPQVIVAINQAVAERGSALAAGDEVAFFPPVTGG